MVIKKQHALIIVFLLTACVSAPPAPPQPQLYWTKAGATQQAYQIDNYNCMRETQSASGSPAYGDITSLNRAGDPPALPGRQQ
jgi:hypothetical protein